MYNKKVWDVHFQKYLDYLYRDWSIWRIVKNKEDKMKDLLKTVEKELKIPKKKLIEEGIIRFLELELRNISLEIKNLERRYGVDSFDGLWQKLETGKVTESECFDDLTKLEYLETEKEKISKLLYTFDRQ